MRKVGRPRIIESPAELNRLVEEYVTKCHEEGEPLQPAALSGDNVIHSKTADLVTTSNQPEKLAISSGLYVPLCA